MKVEMTVDRDDLLKIVKRVESLERQVDELIKALVNDRKIIAALTDKIKEFKGSEELNLSLPNEGDIH